MGRQRRRERREEKVMETNIDLMDALIGAGAVAVPVLLMAVWRWFQKYAKSTETQLDDELVKALQDFIDRANTKEEKKDETS
jgi:hypothetical protein